MEGKLFGSFSFNFILVAFVDFTEFISAYMELAIGKVKKNHLITRELIVGKFWFWVVGTISCFASVAIRKT